MYVVSRTPAYEKACVEAGNGTPCWGFNGNLERPTFTPSLLMRKYEGDVCSHVCHLYMTDGKLMFLSDSSHALKGKTVEMMEVGE